MVNALPKVSLRCEEKSSECNDHCAFFSPRPKGRIVFPTFAKIRWKIFFHRADKWRALVSHLDVRHPTRQAKAKVVRFVQTRFYFDHLTCSRIDHSQVFVFTRSDDARAVVIPRDAENHFRMTIDRRQDRRFADVPNEDLHVAAGTEQDVQRSRMPENLSHPTLMRNEIDGWLSEIRRRQATVGNLPNFNRTIFGTTGDDVVVVRTPGDVENGSFVSGDERNIAIDPADFVQRQDEKGAAACRFSDDSEKFRIDRTKCRVPGAFRNTNILVTILFLCCLTKNMSKTRSFQSDLLLSRRSSYRNLLFRTTRAIWREKKC